MTNITYKRDFQHDDWMDNQDIVQAGGEKGFNSKFHALEKEFDKLTNIIAQINASLVSVVPITTLTFTPTFFRNSKDPNFGSWLLNSDGVAEKEGGKTSVSGLLPLQLPDNTKIKSLTIIGEKNGDIASFQIQLIRQTLLDGKQTILLAVQLADQSGAFKIESQLPAETNAIDNKSNKYFVVAIIKLADASSTAKISGIQLTSGQ